LSNSYENTRYKEALSGYKQVSGILMKLLKAPYSDISQMGSQDPGLRSPSQKDKAVPAQTWTGPEALRFPDNQYKKRLPLPPGESPCTHFC
jgi:hypothetical protein